MWGAPSYDQVSEYRYNIDTYDYYSANVRMSRFFVAYIFLFTAAYELQEASTGKERWEEKDTWEERNEAETCM